MQKGENIFSSSDYITDMVDNEVETKPIKINLVIVRKRLKESVP